MADAWLLLSGSWRNLLKIRKREPNVSIVFADSHFTFLTFSISVGSLYFPQCRLPAIHDHTESSTTIGALSLLPLWCTCICYCYAHQCGGSWVSFPAVETMSNQRYDRESVEDAQRACRWERLPKRAHSMPFSWIESESSLLFRLILIRSSEDQKWKLSTAIDC